MHYLHCYIHRSSRVIFILVDFNMSDNMLIMAFDTEEKRIALYDDDGNSIRDLTDLSTFNILYALQ